MDLFYILSTTKELASRFDYTVGVAVTVLFCRCLIYERYGDSFSRSILISTSVWWNLNLACCWRQNLIRSAERAKHVHYKSVHAFKNVAAAGIYENLNRVMTDRAAVSSDGLVAWWANYTCQCKQRSGSFQFFLFIWDFIKTDTNHPRPFKAPVFRPYSSVFGHSHHDIPGIVNGNLFRASNFLFMLDLSDCAATLKGT